MLSFSQNISIFVNPYNHLLIYKLI